MKLATLDKIKLSLRLDHNYDDEILTDLIETAKAYVINAVDSEAPAGTIEALKQFDWTVSLLVQHWYEYRLSEPKSHIPIQATSLIHQMRGAYDAS